MPEFSDSRIRLVHIITGLRTGGAEMMLYRLLSGIDSRRFQTEVFSLTGIGSVGRKIAELGVPVHSLGMRRGVPNPLALLKLSNALRNNPPDIIQTWMYHADLLGGLSAKLAGNVPVLWGIRNSNLDPRSSKMMTIWTAKASARLSHFIPVRIVCCSQASREVHGKMGYAARKMVVIPNGFDPNTYKPDTSARHSVRQELGISRDAPIVGFVARFDPQKDHRTFVRAAAQLQDRVPDCHFVLCGEGNNWENTQLARWIKSSGIALRCHLLGRRDDIPRLMAAFDVATSSSSYGEGFPNVVAEAMVCGTPCVATDVGDSARIVGDTGIIVPPRDPQALSVGWASLLVDMSREGRIKLGLAARRRIVERFSLNEAIASYERLYTSLVPDHHLETMLA